MTNMTRLEILSLTLEDYRQYKGENKIGLETRGNKNINVIEGQNGAGKSNILNAITLCLYGREAHLEDQEDNELETYPLVNRSRLSEIGENETAEGSIEITLGRGEPEYIFSRDFKTIKLPGGEFSSQLGDLQLKQKSGRDWKSVDQPSTRLNQILPAHVHEYFLFDGERLDNFFAEGYQERVEKGLLDVSHIELIENGMNHLSRLTKDIEGEMTDVGGKEQQKKQEVESARNDLEEIKDELETTKDNIQQKDELINEIDQKLQDSSDPEVREKQKRREYLSDQLSEKRTEIDELEAEAGERLGEAGPVLYAHRSLDYTADQLQELSEKGELPPKIQDWFIEQLIDRGKCICGEDLTPEHKDHLESLHEEMSEVAEENIEGKYTIPNLLDQAIDNADRLLQKRRELAEAEQKEDELNKELNEISEELKSYDLPQDVDVQELEKQREEYTSQLANLREQKGRLEVERDDAKEKKEELERELRALQSKKDENKGVLRRIEFLESAHEELESIKEDILASVRDEIQVKMNEYFNEIIWKDEDFTVILNDDYEVRVEGPQGDNKIGSLSAGERQVLAFSFLSALSSVSGFNAPILIDTPLGRISSTPKKRLAQNLPEYIDETQVTFLMTDEEYTEDVRISMKQHVSNEYKLQFEDEVTKVVNYE